MFESPLLPKGCSKGVLWTFGKGVGGFGRAKGSKFLKPQTNKDINWYKTQKPPLGGLGAFEIFHAESAKKKVRDLTLRRFSRSARREKQKFKIKPLQFFKS
jgi:hypothetical protein